jgi:hypothetical protein
MLVTLSPALAFYQCYALIKRNVSQLPVSQKAREGPLQQLALQSVDKFSHSTQGFGRSKFRGMASSKSLLGMVAPLTKHSQQLSPDSPLALDKAQVHFSVFRGKVPLGGQIRQVVYKDLQQTDLLPTVSLQVPTLAKPILFSRFFVVGEDRVGCLMFVPNQVGHYFPRPIYQSSSRGAWQTPDYVQHVLNKNNGRWEMDYFGKGIGRRGKTETALSPELQKFLSETMLNQPGLKETPSFLYNETVTKVWVGTTGNLPNDPAHCDQACYNRSIDLEQIYKHCKIDTGQRIPLPPEQMVLPPMALPDFKQAVMTYRMRNWVYGDLRGEVYPSQDGKLLWTYYVQESTQRAWVAHVHAASAKDGKIVETGLPAQLVNVGSTIPLAPYEYDIDFEASPEVPKLANTFYVDIWKKYTSKLPVVQAYYQAKGLQCPK